MIEQVVNVCQTTIVQEAWQRGQHLAVHGWVYTISDGLLHDLQICVTKSNEIVSAYQAAVAALL